MYVIQLLRTCFAVAILSAITRSSVIVVNAAGGGQFTDIAPAVAAALEGDTILVKAGSYSRFTVNKGLSVVAESGAVVNVAGPVEVINLAGSQTVVLAGLTVNGTNTTSFGRRAALFLANNVGGVRAHGCTFQGGNGWAGCTGTSGTGVFVENCHTLGVALVDCILVGGDVGYCEFCCGGDGSAVAGGDGLEARTSKVALYDCELQGGDGNHGYHYYGGDGGAGARLQFSGSFLHTSGSTFRGGDGGEACDFAAPMLAGAGGDGIWLGKDTAAWVVESPSFTGTPGDHFEPPWICTEDPRIGPPGEPFAGFGTYFHLPVQKLVMESPSLVREGQDLVLTIRGEPGVAVQLFISEETIFSGAASWRGILLAKKMGMLQHVMVLGIMPPSGVMTTGLDLPDLPPGVGADTRFIQVWRRGSNGRVLGSYVPLTVLDSAY